LLAVATLIGLAVVVVVTLGGITAGTDGGEALTLSLLTGAELAAGAGKRCAHEANKVEDKAKTRKVVRIKILRIERFLRDKNYCTFTTMVLLIAGP
jgi:hypothetical protein